MKSTAIPEKDKAAAIEMLDQAKADGKINEPEYLRLHHYVKSGIAEKVEVTAKGGKVAMLTVTLRTEIYH